jgi:cytochrome c oxidase cbb3-type subunit III
MNSPDRVRSGDSVARMWEPMNIRQRSAVTILAAAALAMALQLPAQNGAPPAAQGAASFPNRPKANATVLARGKDAYKVNCAHCHGEDARGGENGGTNLLRSDFLMKDKNGEVLNEFLHNTDSNGHSGIREGVLKFQFTNEQAGDIAAFIHDFRLSSRDPGRMRPPTIVVGNARAGEDYFKVKCAACHSPEGDLKGVATRFPDPVTLQQSWLMPIVYGFRGPNPRGEGQNTKIPPVTVTVTFADGQKVEGRLGRIDDFIVTLIQADGATRTIRRDGDVPRVEVHDPMKPHKDLLPVYTDTDIHNVTAYLVTLK